MTNWLDDDTWQRLDPRAAQLDQRGRRRLAVMMVIIALVLGGVGLGFRSGLFSPRLVVAPDTLTAADGSRAFTRVLTVRNDGLLDEEILSVAGTAPGIRVVAANPQRGVVPAAGSVRFTVRYAVTDCTNVTERSSAILGVRLARPWGSTSVTLRADGDSSGDAGVISQTCATP